jgi:hypothetical protein
MGPLVGLDTSFDWLLRLSLTDGCSGEYLFTCLSDSNSFNDAGGSLLI